MALDRQFIARRDFPTQRRGYDPAAVDAHLEEVAGQVEALQRRAATPPTASDQAAEQVKAIVQAAERGAEEIREAARAEAREHVARAAGAADRLHAKIEELVAGAERLRDELAAARAEAGALGGAAPAAAMPAARTEEAARAEEAASVERAVNVERAAPAKPSTSAPAASPNGDTTAARIVALNMALSGKPREETDRYLAEHYDVPDRGALLDEVYTAAGA